MGSIGIIDDAVPSSCCRLMMRIRLNNVVRRLLPNNRFARSVSVLAGGTAAGQIIVIAASPIVTRLYTPEDFGLLAVYAGVLGMLGVVTCLRYQLAIPLPESDREAAAIAILSVSAVVGVTFVTAIAVLFFGDSLALLLNTPGISPYLWLIPLGVFLTGLYQVVNLWAVRLSAFREIARTKLIQSVSMVTIQVGGYALGPISLLLGRVAGQSAGVLSLGRHTIERNLIDFQKTEKADVRRAAQKHRNFPLLSTWTGLSSAGGIHLPPLLIATFFGAGPAGLFSLTHRVLSQPMTVVGRAVSDVFYREAAQAYREESLHNLVENVYNALVAIALPLAVVFFISAPALFSFVFGSDWNVAGEMARWMTPWLFFNFVSAPPTRVYPILDRHGVALVSQLSLLLSGVFSVLIGGLLFNSVIKTVMLMALANSFMYVARLVVTYHLLSLRPMAPLMTLIRESPISVACSSPLILLWIAEGKVAFDNRFSISFFVLACFLVSATVVRNIKRWDIYGEGGLHER